MKINALHFGLVTCFLIACSDKPVEDERIGSPDSLAVDNHATLNAGNIADNESGPPFSDTCKATFEYIGQLRINSSRQDLIVSGKGWNPQYHSCSWTWGELINNEAPEDTLVTDFRIHLLDLNKLPKVLDTTIISSKEFKENLIATYSISGSDQYATTKFDPNQTGKYPVPKYWSE